MTFIKLIKKKTNNLLFTTPSHSQKTCILRKFRQFYKYDVSETDTHQPEQMLIDAENYASEVYSTRKTKFLTNGSTSGVLTSILSVVNPGEQVLLWRNAHRCHLNSVKLSGGQPVFYDLPINDFGVPVPDYNLEPLFKTNKIKALIITSPTYEGYVSDIKSIKKLCEKYNSYLIVDEAHGALYPFSDRLPESAIKYADFTVQSLHKTAGGLNPTALLHCNCDADIDEAFNKISTTSPSYPLLMSIERNIKYLASVKGKKEINKLIDNLENFRNIVSVDFGGDDITKILIRKNGMSGYELSEYLYSNKIEDEKTNEISTMLLTGIGTTKNKLDKLKLVLRKL